MGGVRALGTLGGDTAIAWLVDLTEDKDVRVAGAAMSALGTADSGRARFVARDLLDHIDTGVRATAIGILGRQLSSADVSVLLEAFARAQSDDDADARLAVIRALGRKSESDPSVAMTFFRQFPSSTDYNARRTAAQAFPDSIVGWGPIFPVETGRTKDDYRQIVRRFLLPGERGELPRWELETERGRIEIDFYSADAPITAHTFFQLTEQGYFDGGRWHRVVHNFVIQDGDPRGDGSGGPGFTIRDELNRHRYQRGSVGMALGGPDTGGSQFFITHAMQPHLDGTYTVFGRVRSGLGIVDETTQGDRLRSARVRR
jgi:cyclophilin family peptidyl-prolyl cis-trans isomerase